MEDGHACAHCKASNSFVSTNEDTEVCRECGHVSNSTFVGRYNKFDKSNTIFEKLDGKGTKRKKGSDPDFDALCEDMQEDAQQSVMTTYKRIFHFNERLAQLNVCEPAIPLELFNLIVQKYYRLRKKSKKELMRCPDELTKEDIKTLCNLIKVPPELQSKYQSKKFKQKAHMDMKRYTEKWIAIRSYLGGYKPPKLDPEDLHTIRSLFLDLQVPFEKVRHNPGCDGSTKCHKSPGKCRHNFLNYNYVIIQLLRRMGMEHIYRPWLPQLKTPDKLKKLNQYWKTMTTELGWDYVEVRKKFGKDKHGWRKKLRAKEEEEKEKEEEQKNKESLIIIPAESEFQIGPDVPQAEQDEVVEQWAQTLRERFKFKSYDDNTLDPNDKGKDKEEEKKPDVIDVRTIEETEFHDVEWV